MPVRILESGGLPHGANEPIRRVPFITQQTPIAATSTSAQSAAFNAGTRIVTVQSDEAVHVTFGANPTATTSHFKIGAGETHDFGVAAGDKMAVRTA
jgi:hypothetical protein